METAPGDVLAVLRDQVAAAVATHAAFVAALRGLPPGDPLPAGIRLLTHDIHRYDGVAFVGRPPGQVEPCGAGQPGDPRRRRRRGLDAAYGNRRPSALGGTAPAPAGAAAGLGADLGYRRLTTSADGYHDGWYAYRDRRGYDVQDPGAAQRRGAVTALLDALGHRTDVAPDPTTWMFPATITDPRGTRHDGRVRPAPGCSDRRRERTRDAGALHAPRPGREGAA